MDVEWEEANIGSAAVKTGHFQLFKFCGLAEDDDDLPLSRFIGLSRHEFFDALLCVARLSDVHWHSNNCDCDNSTLSALFRLFDELAVGHLNWTFRNIMDLKQVLNVENGEIERRIKLKLKAQSTTLIKLFKKYATLRDLEQCQLAEDQWCAMALELCDAAEQYHRTRWKHGGRPTMDEIVQCFVLCKDTDQLLMDDEIDFVSFQRCLCFVSEDVFQHHKCTNE